MRVFLVATLSNNYQNIQIIIIIIIIIMIRNYHRICIVVNTVANNRHDTGLRYVDIYLF